MLHYQYNSLVIQGRSEFSHSFRCLALTQNATIMSRKTSKRNRSKKIQIGDKSLIYDKQVTEMSDSNDLYNNGNFKELRQRLENEGSIFLRNVIQPDYILKAREELLTQAAKDKSIKADAKNALNNAKICRTYAISHSFIFL